MHKLLKKGFYYVLLLWIGTVAAKPHYDNVRTYFDWFETIQIEAFLIIKVK